MSRTSRLHRLHSHNILLIIALLLIPLVWMNQGIIHRLAQDYSWVERPFLFLAAWVFIALVLAGLLLLGSIPRVFKLWASLLILIGAATFPYNQDFGTLFDRTMISTILKTDVHEAGETLYTGWLIKFGLLGVMPCLILWRLKIHWPRDAWWSRYLLPPFLGVLCLGLAIGVLLTQSQALVAFGRNHREIRHMVFPISPILASISLARHTQAEVRGPRQIVGPAAVVAPPLDKPLLTLLVIGETARAANYELGGYAKATNPYLKARLAQGEGLYYFQNASSCGTLTEYSVPCLLSPFGRSDYNSARRYSHETILQILQRLGVKVVWGDNNSGCQNQCDDIPYVEAKPLGSDKECPQGRCQDGVIVRLMETLLPKPSQAEPAKQNQLLIAHLLGSHGPAYYERVPPEFAKFTPLCEDRQLANCSLESIRNSYDNTILYTDYILDSLIKLLEPLAKDYHVMLIYASDHGESLGENGIYLHGLPYAIAPSTQTHIPMLIWLPPATANALKLDGNCLKNSLSNQVSHDNLFYSLFDLYARDPSVSRPELNLLAACQTHS